MAKLAGDACKIKIEDIDVLGIRSISRNLDVDMAEATTQDSTDRWKEYIPLYKNASYSVELLTDSAANGTTTLSREELYDYLAVGTQVTIYYGSIVVGETYWTQEGFIMSVGETNEYGDLQAVSVEIQGTGEPTKATVSA